MSGLPDDGNHTEESLAFAGGVMYVASGSATNRCQHVDRQSGSPGQDPCHELERRAGGLAVGTDGSLFIAADANGRIWKVVRR